MIISGHVQGVMFRQAAVEVAEGLGVQGWIRNLSSGRVELVIEGPPEDIGEMVDWCRHGPPSARVQDVDLRPELPQGERGRFSIRPSEGHGSW
ncbi:MAG: acylphosphatase [Chloroflexota bacterium]